MNRMAIRRTAGALVASLAILVAFVAIPALGDHQSNHETLPWEPVHNQASWWQNTYGPDVKGETDWLCVKTDNRGASGGYTLGNPPEGRYWRLLVVKAGSDHNDLYWDPVAGQTYAATGQGAGGWSHVIACSRPLPPTTTTSTTTTSTTTTSTTTTSTTTTSTTTTSTTTTTTVPEETTTTTLPEETTTTTLPEETTTTTVPEETTTTTIPPEVEETTTTTIPPEVSSTTIGTTPETLPFTGAETDDLASMALAALLVGTGLVLLSRGSAEARGAHRP